MKQEQQDDAPRPAGKSPLLALSLLNLDMSALEAYADDLMKKNRIRTVRGQDIIRAAEDFGVPQSRPEKGSQVESFIYHPFPG
ncbi:MAG: hypothetical protein IH612_08645 [Desulfofustis sp.]|nr:hypothetical protein [Desulfofustis sp.]